MQNWSTTSHFDCVQPALVVVEVLFCRLCTFHCDCAGIARQPFPCIGSVAYLLPLTVATVLEECALCISDRSRLLTSNLTVLLRINYFALASVFIAIVPFGKGVCSLSVLEVYSFVARLPS